MAIRIGRLGRNGFLVIAVIFHFIYAMSIFDIYFVSPIVHGMRPYSVEEVFGRSGVQAPAKRLVLFVGDGLRADKAFQSFPDPSPPYGTSPEDAAEPRPLMPFLRQKVLKEGTFGVSHTRVPTESRPGHVALIAGLYEDVSAVTTGWKLNPVNFDSVFNRSRHTWSWGSPDILPMFKEGATEGVIDAYTYSAKEEDFTSDAVKLDLWVFDRVKQMFADAKTNPALDSQLRQDKVVFFLHLLGLDTTGHGYRPYSKEYLHNVKVVDQGVREITELIDEFYNDGKTAYVFTADHGMSDWGSHGDGHPDNTRTPLVAWGSGVAKPVTVGGIWGSGGQKAKGHEDGFSADWGFDHVQRNDVAQADVAALMAYLAGLEFPLNSVGELPLPYLDAPPRQKAEALLVNALEILEQYHVKEEQKKSTKLRYVPYAPFANSEHSVDKRVANIKSLIKRNKADEAIKNTEALIQDALQGMRYLQTYDWLFLRALVTIGYLGWIAYALTTVVDMHVLHGSADAQRTTGSAIFFSSVLAALFGMLAVQRSAWTYYCYTVFPVFFWEEVWARRGALIEGRQALLGHLTGRSWMGLLVKSVAYVGLLEVLVQSYFTRELYTVCYIGAISWPFFYGLGFVRANKQQITTWALSCAALSAFTLLPANKTESLNLVLGGGGLMFVVGVLYLLFEDSLVQTERKCKGSLPVSRMVVGAQVGLVLLAMIVTRSSAMSLRAKQGLPLGTQVVGWLVMILSIVLPFAHSLEPSNHYLHRLIVIFLTFSPSFVILTISYEGLFYLAFCVLLLTWVRLEHHIYRYVNTTQPAGITESTTQSNGKVITSATTANGAAIETSSPPSANGPVTLSAAKLSEANTNKGQQLATKNYRALTLSDFRTSLFSLYLLQSAFFSTGNIASISSFSLDAVNRLIPVFDPFSQGALLIFKILIPFALLSAALGILNQRLGIGGGALMMVLMGVGDYMTVRFFWMVKDEGSWLEIGSSISCFGIASALAGFVGLLEAVSGVMLGGVVFGDEDDDAKREEPGHSNGEVNGKLKPVR